MRVTDIPGLVLPTWQQVLDRHYEPWTTAHVVDTAGRTLEEVLPSFPCRPNAARSLSPDHPVHPARHPNLAGQVPALRCAS